MFTKKLFQDDSYLKKFKARVIEHKEKNLVLSETVFYAISGGQPGDTGVINFGDKILTVIDTVKGEGNSIVHITEETDIKIPKDSEIEGEIDWDRRYILMKNHTALHILNALILRDTGAMVTGGQLGIDKSRMDFNTQGMDKEHMEKLIEECNRIVNESRDIKIEYIPYEEFEKDEILVRTIGTMPPKTEDNIRLVNIEGLDRQACGGTHLKNTGEINSIRLKKLQNKGKNNKRVYIIVD